ncbi:CD109 antigen-like [Physella acuta]|uniref:CD109 antigen-like n=1 Tax=Physella acuta TaxID=109671 RepID=UPI0027DB62D5|nr:CD109 antigen-like [Physella acuta]
MSGSKRIQSYYFTVEEFVLPKFSVEVKASQSFLVSTDPNSRSTLVVESKYTYGKGVQGSCKVTLSFASKAITLHKELSSAGQAEFNDISWSSLMAIGDVGSISVKAEVLDETGRTETGVTTINLYKHKVALQILDTSTVVLREGIPAHINVKVSDHDGNAVSPVEVVVSVDHSGTGFTNYQTTLQVPAGETTVSTTYTPTLKDGSSISNYWYSDPSGSITAYLVSNSDISSQMTVYKYQSKQGQSIAIHPVHGTNLVLGQEAEFVLIRKVKQNNNQSAGYIVVSQGNIIDAGPIAGDKLHLSPTLGYSPTAKLLVYMIVGSRQESELVVDTIQLSVARKYKKEVSVLFDSRETRTGTDVDMNVDVSRTDGSNDLPGVHDVYYLAVDKSIILLQGGTDLNKAKILDGLSSFDIKENSERSVPYSAYTILKGITITWLTPVTVQRKKDKINKFRNKLKLVRLGENVQDVAAAKPPIMAKDDQYKVIEAPRIRKEFPDTWLWGSGQTSMQGKMRTRVTLPDTITSWMVSAFAINREGLAVTEKPFELTAFQLFFLSMNLPYSIKRGEIFILKITVFNYRNQNVNAVVALARSDQFSVDGAEENNGWYEKPVSMQANQAASVEYKLNATRVGQMDLHVKATDEADGQQDEVIRKLLVKPEGEERSRALTKVLIVSSGDSLNDTFHINWPHEKIVPDSKRVEVKITGDIFGQALSGLDRLVTVPFGCGEQNMITTVPNIFGLKYIRRTGQQGLEQTELKLTQNMKIGYQRQIENYRHKDGSYSAWGEKGSGSSFGSTWLTAFVMRSFSQASEFISVDPEVLSSGVQFLSARQSNNGSFQELGVVFHSEMQSGTASGHALTVYVFLSVMEASAALASKDKKIGMENEMAKASQYILKYIRPEELQASGNKFLAALSAYALSLIPQPTNEITALRDQLLKVVVDLGVPWQEEEGMKENLKKVAAHDGAVDQDADLGPPYRLHTSSTKDLEIGAYLLLAYTKLGRVPDGLPLMKWLQSQQNSNGGFQSTQDTIMVLQAISEFGSIFGTTKADGSITVQADNNQPLNHSIAGSRSLLLQIFLLPENTQVVKVNLIGSKSVAVVKVVYTYHTYAGDDDAAPLDSTLYLSTKATKISPYLHAIEACVKSTSPLQNKGMFVATMNLPSGERPYEDPAQIMANNPMVSRVDTDEQTIHFYMDQAPSGDGYCLKAHVERQLVFEVQKPGAAKFYPYYDPENGKEVSLSLDGSCANNKCDKDGAVVLNVASLLLTTIICTLISLLACV